MYLMFDVLKIERDNRCWFFIVLGLMKVKFHGGNRCFMVRLSFVFGF